MSVGDLFLGAVFPGALLSGLYIGYLLLVGWLQPERACTERTHGLGGDQGPVTTILPPGFLILAVLGSIFLGLWPCPPKPQASALAAHCCWQSSKLISQTVMREVLRETTRTTACIFVLLEALPFPVGFCQGLGGDELIECIAAAFEPTGIIIAILFAAHLGFFLDWIELTLIVLPLVAPVVANLGFDPIWFTILFAVCLQTSFLTPPVEFAIFISKGSHRKNPRHHYLSRGHTLHRPPGAWHARYFQLAGPCYASAKPMDKRRLKGDNYLLSVRAGALVTSSTCCIRNR